MPELEAAVRAAWARFRQGDRTGGLTAVAELAHGHPDVATVRGAYASLLWATGAHGDAVREAEATLALDSDEAGAHTVLGRAALRSRRLKQAIGHLARAYGRSPTARRAELWVRALREAGDLDEAAAVLGRERERDDRLSAALRREEALLAEGRGEADRAAALWTELLEDPGEGAFARGRLLRLRTRDMPGDRAAEELLAAARVRSANDPEAGREILLAAADRRRADGDLLGAAEAYRRYLEERPGDPYVLRQLAFVLRRQGLVSEAQPLLETLLRAEPGDAYVRNALVADYMAAGEAEEGLSLLRAVLAEHPEAKGLYAAIRRLRAGTEGASREGREAAADALRRAGRRGRKARADGTDEEGR